MKVTIAAASFFDGFVDDVEDILEGWFAEESVGHAWPFDKSSKQLCSGFPEISHQ